MVCIGLGAALGIVWLRRKILQLRIRAITEYILSCTIFVLINSKLLFAIAMIPSMEKVTINEFLYYLWNGGIVFYGGLSGTILGIVIVSKYEQISASKVLNTIAPAFPLFHFFARIGCLLAGCCYGVECSWGVILADDPGIIRFPVQLVESICNLIIFIGLVFLEHRKKNYEYHFKIYLSSYAFCRFILEFCRGDDVRGIWIGGFSTSQYISVFIIALCGITSINEMVKKSKIIER